MTTGFGYRTAPKCSNLKEAVVRGTVRHAGEPLITAMPTNKIAKAIVRGSGSMEGLEVTRVEIDAHTTMMDNVEMIVRTVDGVGPRDLHLPTHPRTANVKEEAVEVVMPAPPDIGIAISPFVNREHSPTPTTIDHSECPMAVFLLMLQPQMLSCKGQLPAKSATNSNMEVKRLW